MHKATLAICMLASTSTANAQSPINAAATATNERAYTVTLMCAVVASKGTSDSDKVRTMDAARKMAKANGYSTDRLSRDLLGAATIAGRNLRNNPNALDGDRAMCRKLGLIS